MRPSITAGFLTIFQKNHRMFFRKFQPGELSRCYSDFGTPKKIFLDIGIQGYQR